MEKKIFKKGISIFSIVIFTILLLYVVSLVVPLIWALLTSLKGKLEFYSNPFGLPKKWLWKNYVTAVKNFTSPYNKGGVVRTVYIGEMLKNSLIYSVGA